MKSIKGFFVFALAGLLFAPVFHAQSEYLRVVNLLPITAKRVDLYQGATPYVTGMKPGYIQNYSELPTGGNHFSLQQNGAVVGEFTLPPSSNGFFTVVIYQDAGSPPKIAFYSDEIKKEEPKPDEPPPPPVKRLRLYLGGYDFPIKVSVQSLGEWTIVGKAQFLDMNIPGNPPDAVFVEYKDRYDQTIKVAYPTYLASGEASSVFISQRGVKRVNLGSSLDNLAPQVTDSEDSANPQPTPAP